MYAYSSLLNNHMYRNKHTYQNFSRNETNFFGCLSYAPAFYMFYQSQSSAVDLCIAWKVLEPESQKKLNLFGLKANRSHTCTDPKY